MSQTAHPRGPGAELRHKKLLDGLCGLDALPAEAAAFQAWLPADAHLDLLRRIRPFAGRPQCTALTTTSVWLLHPHTLRGPLPSVILPHLPARTSTASQCGMGAKRPRQSTPREIVGMNPVARLLS